MDKRCESNEIDVESCLPDRDTKGNKTTLVRGLTNESRPDNMTQLADTPTEATDRKFTTALSIIFIVMGLCLILLLLSPCISAMQDSSKEKRQGKQ